MKCKAIIMDEAAMNRSIIRIAHEITEHNRGAENVVLVGIIRRGGYLATRISEEIERIEGVKVPVGSLDITFYRDDLSKLHKQPMVNDTSIDFDITGRNVVLVDDVIFTGRTVRAAMEALFHIGRPSTVQLAVMIDRGLRELPFKADYVGKNIPTSRTELVSVKVADIDGENSVSIYSMNED